MKRGIVLTSVVELIIGIAFFVAVLFLVAILYKGCTAEEQTPVHLDFERVVKDVQNIIESEDGTYYIPLLSDSADEYYPYHFTIYGKGLAPTDLCKGKACICLYYNHHSSLEGHFEKCETFDVDTCGEVCSDDPCFANTGFFRPSSQYFDIDKMTVVKDCNRISFSVPGMTHYTFDMEGHKVESAAAPGLDMGEHKVESAAAPGPTPTQTYTTPEQEFIGEALEPVPEDTLDYRDPVSPRRIGGYETDPLTGERIYQ